VADAPPIRAEAEVRLWGETVGALVELESGRILFEYADAFRRGGLEISPVHLPLAVSGPRSFEELRRKDAFRGLPGVFADALPDAFGRRVIRAWYAARGEPDRALSPVQQLLYVGERALGALTFHPAEETRPAEQEALEVQALAHDAREIVEGRTDVVVLEIYRIGSSAGGKRPKAIVHFDPGSGTIRSGGTEPRAGEVPCLLKFDGIGPDHTTDRLGSPQPYNRVEAAYADMARAAGVDMPGIEVLEVEGYAHLLIRRFDVRDGSRRHQHTLGGMLHLDYNDVGAASYEEYLRTVRRLGMAYDALTQAFVRMSFNVLAVNQDDHVKNFSFHMDRSGTWSLTPAYDVTFAKGEGWTRTHQMRIRDRLEGFGAEDLVAVADAFGVKRPGRILDRVREAIGRWETCAAGHGVPRDAVRTIRGELDRRDREVFGPGTSPA